MSNNTTVNGLNVKFRADSVQFDEGVKGMNSAIRLLKVELTRSDLRSNFILLSLFKIKLRFRQLLSKRPLNPTFSNLLIPR